MSIEPDMPTPCQSCGEWFELNNMVGSEKWYPNTVICETCSTMEEQEIQLDEEIENEENNLKDAQWQITESTKELGKLRLKQEELQMKIEKHREQQ